MRDLFENTVVNLLNFFKQIMYDIDGVGKGAALFISFFLSRKKKKHGGYSASI